MAAVLMAGLMAATLLLGAIVWSILVPARRLWPPKRTSAANKVIVWALVLVIFGSAFWLGMSDWNAWGWPIWLRWGLGMPLILIGNLVVWRGVAEIGLRATSGDATGLHIDGPYAYSRNPQYVADMAILLGWTILSATPLVLPVAGAGILVLAVAPQAEEKWLAEAYGDEYEEYRRRGRRDI